MKRGTAQRSCLVNPTAVAEAQNFAHTRNTALVEQHELQCKYRSSQTRPSLLDSLGVAEHPEREISNGVKFAVDVSSPESIRDSGEATNGTSTRGTLGTSSFGLSPPALSRTSSARKTLIGQTHEFFRQAQEKQEAKRQRSGSQALSSKAQPATPASMKKEPTVVSLWTDSLLLSLLKYERLVSELTKEITLFWKHTDNHSKHPSWTRTAAEIIRETWWGLVSTKRMEANLRYEVIHYEPPRPRSPRRPSVCGAMPEEAGAVSDTRGSKLGLAHGVIAAMRQTAAPVWESEGSNSDSTADGPDREDEACDWPEEKRKRLSCSSPMHAMVAQLKTGVSELNDADTSTHDRGRLGRPLLSPGPGGEAGDDGAWRPASAPAARRSLTGRDRASSLSGLAPITKREEAVSRSTSGGKRMGRARMRLKKIGPVVSEVKDGNVNEIALKLPNASRSTMQMSASAIKACVSLQTSPSQCLQRAAIAPSHGPRKRSPRKRADDQDGCGAAKPGIEDDDSDHVNSDLIIGRRIKACEKRQVVPRRVVIGHSVRLRAIEGHITDRDLQVVAAVIPGMKRVEEVDVEGNTRLTDSALVPFLQALCTVRASESLEKLFLNQCRNAGLKTLRTVVDLLSLPRGAANLRELDLSGIPVSSAVQPSLCRAIQDHKCLTSARLCEVGLGIGSGTRQCLAGLLSSRTLEELDIGWNTFDADAFSYLGDLLLENTKLKTLSLPSCTTSSKTGGSSSSSSSSILFFLEKLSGNIGLTSMDISLNHIDFSGSLVLEDSLEHHRRLTHLAISHSPLGVSGMRCLLRTLLGERSGLLGFSAEGCGIDHGTDGGPGSETQQYSRTNPGSRYTLDLARPYHRALLRMLYKTCDHFQIASNICFTDVQYSGGKYKHPSKDRGRWAVQTSGKLAMTFSVERGLSNMLKDLYDADFGVFLERQFALTRLRPSYRKVVPFLVMFKSVRVTHLEKAAILNALSKDFLITYPQIKELCREAGPIGVEIVRRLFHCIEGGPSARYLTTLLTPSLADFLSTQKHIKNFLHFNVENPTGNYKLQLENHADYAIAERLILLDAWESGAARRRKQFDISQRGNWSQVRNERYMDRPLVGVSSIAEWTLPDVATLELDYVSGRRVPQDTPAVDQDTFNQIMVTLRRSQCSNTDRIKALRCISHHLFIEAKQLREMLGTIVDARDDRAEIYVIFIFRVVDICNEKIIRARFSDEKDLQRIRRRIGLIPLFPFIQPEHADFTLDLSIYEERLALCILVKMANLEGAQGAQVLRGPMKGRPLWIRADGRWDPLTAGVPPSWQEHTRITPEGTFKLTYACAPECRKYKMRVQLLKAYGNWDGPPRENQVDWWAALGEAPEDVLLYLEFLIPRFEDVFGAFDKMDRGHGTRGVLSRLEFEKGYQAMVKEFKYDKFASADSSGEGEVSRQQRLANIFRFLDPSGEGEVSRQEWGILEYLWKEWQQTIVEFVRFLDQNFSDTWLQEFSIAFSESWADEFSDEFSILFARMTGQNFLIKGQHAKVFKVESQILDHDDVHYSLDPRPVEGDFPLQVLRAQTGVDDILRTAWRNLVHRQAKPEEDITPWDDIEGIEIHQTEWTEAVKERLHYFGSTETIFKFLDKDDQGDVTWDEFEVLQTVLSKVSSRVGAQDRRRAQKPDGSVARAVRTSFCGVEKKSSA